MTIIPIHRNVLIKALETVLAASNYEGGLAKTRKQLLNHLKFSSNPELFEYIMVSMNDFTYLGLNEYAPSEPVTEVGLGTIEQG